MGFFRNAAIATLGTVILALTGCSESLRYDSSTKRFVPDSGTSYFDAGTGRTTTIIGNRYIETGNAQHPDYDSRASFSIVIRTE